MYDDKFYAILTIVFQFVLILHVVTRLSPHFSLQQAQ